MLIHVGCVADGDTNIPLTLSVRNVTCDTCLPNSEQIFSYELLSSFGPALTVS